MDFGSYPELPPPPPEETPAQTDAKLNEIAIQRAANRKRQTNRASLRTDGTGLSINSQGNSGIGQ